jgi:hypothetical protein
MRDVSLGSLCVLVGLRALVHTLAKLNDFYLVETLLACVGNLAPHVELLHPYVYATITHPIRSRPTCPSAGLHREGLGVLQSKTARKLLPAALPLLVLTIPSALMAVFIFQNCPALPPCLP